MEVHEIVEGWKRKPGKSDTDLVLYLADTVNKLLDNNGLSGSLAVRTEGQKVKGLETKIDRQVGERVYQALNLYALIGFQNHVWQVTGKLGDSVIAARSMNGKSTADIDLTKHHVKILYNDSIVLLKNPVGRYCHEGSATKNLLYIKRFSGYNVVLSNMHGQSGGEFEMPVRRLSEYSFLDEHMSWYKPGVKCHRFIDEQGKFENLVIDSCLYNSGRSYLVDLKRLNGAKIIGFDVRNIFQNHIPGWVADYNLCFDPEEERLYWIQHEFIESLVGKHNILQAINSKRKRSDFENLVPVKRVYQDGVGGACVVETEGDHVDFVYPWIGDLNV